MDNQKTDKYKSLAFEMYCYRRIFSLWIRMLSPVLLLKPQNITTSLTYNTLRSSQPSYLHQLFTIQPPHSTRSSSSLTLLRPSVTSSLKFSNRSIAVAVPPLWNKLPPTLRQISDSSYELTQTSPLAISPQLFHSKLKTRLFSKSYPDLSSSLYLPPRLNSKHHSRLTVCLPDSLDLDRCLSILFWLSACE